jgi:integrase
MVRLAGVEPAWTCAQDMWVAKRTVGQEALERLIQQERIHRKGSGHKGKTHQASRDNRQAWWHCGMAHLSHTYGSMLRQLGVDVKVQQELLRHADVRTTMNVYTQAVREQKRGAHSSVVRMVLA